MLLRLLISRFLSQFWDTRGTNFGGQEVPKCNFPSPIDAWKKEIMTNTHTHTFYVYMIVQQQNHACNLSKLFKINITSCFNAHVNAIFSIYWHVQEYEIDLCKNEMKHVIIYVGFMIFLLRCLPPSTVTWLDNLFLLMKSRVTLPGVYASF